MAHISMREMLEAGVHFGHQTNRWDPRMKPYIFGARNGVYIIDLQQTVPLFNKAFDFLMKLTANGEKVLFVGTKRQAQDIVAEHAVRAEQFFVNNRWLGGTLTNYKTIRDSIARLQDIEKKAEDGTFEKLTKKEVLKLTRERTKLERNLGGIKEMTRLPGALFVVDTRKEHIAIAEAQKLGIPVVALVDTNCNPQPITHVIPGNDDAIRSIRIFVSRAADACAEGNAIRQKSAGGAGASHSDSAASPTEAQDANADQREGPPVEIIPAIGGGEATPATEETATAAS